MSNELNTFGAILSYAIELEGTLQTWYGRAKDQAELFADYARKAGKRKQRLTEIRQANVTEMILEPITGLDPADYTLSLDTPADAAAALRQAVELETRVRRFYEDCGPKLNVTEPRRAFQKFAQEAAERLDELKALANI